MANNALFTKVQVNRPPTSTFDLSHDHKTTLAMGKLIPINCIECIPGDKIRIKNEVLLRFLPLIAPVMHKIDVYIHHFFVPNRIVWKEWENFISPPTEDSVPPAFPIICDEMQPLDVAPSSLANYLGLPLTGSEYASPMISQPISALPFAAYQRIWYDYYRDQNLIEMEDFRYLQGGTQGIYTSDFTGIRRRAWEHDYFTSALPFAQKGSSVNIPLQLAGKAEVKLDDENYPHSPRWQRAFDGNAFDTQEVGYVTTGRQFLPQLTSDSQIEYDPNGSLYVEGHDFTDMEGTINDLRTAFTLQKFLELNARAGTRYIETIKAHFSVSSSDKRLQRAEYIGGMKAPVVISEVLQTSATDPDPDSDLTPQANMAGHAVVADASKTHTYFCEEHGYFMSIMSIMPQTAYYQGIPKHFQKFDKYDYAWPLFAHLGEQPVYNKELFYTNTPDYDNAVFGYLPRYTEYKYHPHRVSGQMADTLEFWHLGRKFEDHPQLNSQFIQCEPSNRIFAVNDQVDNIVAHVFSKLKINRRLPFYGKPGGL